MQGKGRDTRKVDKGKKDGEDDKGVEAQASESRKKRFDESGREREGRKTSFSASAVSRRNTENAIAASSCVKRAQAT